MRLADVWFQSKLSSFHRSIVTSQSHEPPAGTYTACTTWFKLHAIAHKESEATEEKGDEVNVKAMKAVRSIAEQLVPGMLGCLSS